jgi:hypothetical protein
MLEMLYRGIEDSKNYQQKKLNFELFGKYLTRRTLYPLTSIFCVDNSINEMILILTKNLAQHISDFSERSIYTYCSKDIGHQVVS